MAENTHNLFVYGSLRDPIVLESICGFSFTLKRERTSENKLFAEPALLDGYRKASPDNVYYYAAPDENNKIEGYIIYNLTEKAIKDIDHYEGRRYKKEFVKVNTANGLIEAAAYLAKPESMNKEFGDRWHINLIEELWLRKRIEEFIEKKTKPGEDTDDAKYERIAERELIATTERDLVMTHYRHSAFSDYYLHQELDKPRPSIKKLYDNPQAQPFIENYLRLVVKQVILNRFDERLVQRHRHYLENIRTSERYFKRAISLVAALRMINSNKDAFNMIIDSIMSNIDYGSDLFDYVKYAVNAAESIFDDRLAKKQLEYIVSCRHPGLIPIGAEIELSNLGCLAVNSHQNPDFCPDKAYDGFNYFYDFYLDVLSWKVGGCIDDHSGSTDRGARRGFLEFAPGRLSVAAELSRPVAADPWTLNQLINGMVKFYDIAPHSLHLSYQMRKNQQGNQKVLPLDFVLCLLAIGGGLEQNSEGDLEITRVSRGEIIYSRDGNQEFSFARASRRKWTVSNEERSQKILPHTVSNVFQYKFIRLLDFSNYEPLIVGLKGLQSSYNPADYLTFKQMQENPQLKEDYNYIIKWSKAPCKLSKEAINNFTSAVYDGLMRESHGKPAHKLHYIDWIISSIYTKLSMFNEMISKTQEDKPIAEQMRVYKECPENFE